MKELKPDQLNVLKQVSKDCAEAWLILSKWKNHNFQELQIARNQLVETRNTLITAASLQLISTLLAEKIYLGLAHFADHNYELTLNRVESESVMSELNSVLSTHYLDLETKSWRPIIQYITNQ